MLVPNNPINAYEQFKLRWMIDHGYGLDDLIRNLESMIEEDGNASGVRTSLQSLYSDWEFGIGFDGTIWPCYQEFLETEYSVIPVSE